MKDLVNEIQFGTYSVCPEIKKKKNEKKRYQKRGIPQCSHNYRGDIKSPYFQPQNERWYVEYKKKKLQGASPKASTATSQQAPLRCLPSSSPSSPLSFRSSS